MFTHYEQSQSHCQIITLRLFFAFNTFSFTIIPKTHDECRNTFTCHALVPQLYSFSFARLLIMMLALYFFTVCVTECHIVLYNALSICLERAYDAILMS